MKKNTQYFVNAIVLCSIATLFVYTERQHNQREELFTRVDQTMLKADSALIQAMTTIRTTDSIIAVLREQREIMEDVEYNRRLNGINE